MERSRSFLHDRQVHVRAPKGFNYKPIIEGPRSINAAYAGRVNLIGEHIDYEGYAVLPMAIKQVFLRGGMEL